MRAVVTGAAGFIGRHMVRALAARGYDVVDDRWDIAEGTDAHDMFRRPAWAQRPVSLIVHAAASQPHRAAIDGDPMHLVRNLHLDVAMFDWAVRTGTRVLYLSSSAAYPVELQTGPHHPLREDDIDEWLREPDAAYGWTKLTGEKMAAAAGQHTPVHIVRPFSGYGEDQDPRFPFGAFAARARRRDDPFVIWGDGTQVRDWVHVSDVVAACLAIVDADVRQPVNICTGIGTSMADVARAMWAQAGYQPRLELHPEQPAGVAYRVGSVDRLKQLYVPAVGLEEGVRRALGRTEW